MIVVYIFLLVQDPSNSGTETDPIRASKELLLDHVNMINKLGAGQLDLDFSHFAF